jgi:hypothetical protein
MVLYNLYCGKKEIGGIKMKYQEFVFETAYEACEFATECGDKFVRYNGTSWKTEDDGDYGVVVEGE